MRLRHKKGAEDDILKSKFCLQNNCNTKISQEEIFNNTNPLHLELGMGKGQFVIKMAEKSSNINFIGIEKSATIVLKAIDRLKKDLGVEIPPSNLRFLCIDIDNIENFFEENSIDEIYLNFSDPWPKKRHESRRLTHLNFLNKYEKILKNGAMIEFKTDNVELFDFSIEEINKSNFKIISKTYDLHSDQILNKDNIMTEYEEKFSSKGNKICKLTARVIK